MSRNTSRSTLLSTSLDSPMNCRFGILVFICLLWVATSVCRTVWGLTLLLLPAIVLRCPFRRCAARVWPLTVTDLLITAPSLWACAYGRVVPICTAVSDFDNTRISFLRRPDLISKALFLLPSTRGFHRFSCPFSGHPPRLKFCLKKVVALAPATVGTLRQAFLKPVSRPFISSLSSLFAIAMQ